MLFRKDLRRKEFSGGATAKKWVNTLVQPFFRLDFDGSIFNSGKID